MKEHLENDCISPFASESFRSRLMFAEAQIFGRCAKLALRAVGQPTIFSVSCSLLSDDLTFAMAWMLERLAHAPPKEVRVVQNETLLLFVDSACEPACHGGATNVTSVGAVLVDQSGRDISCFWVGLLPDVMAAWSGGVRDQLMRKKSCLTALPWSVGQICLLESTC